MSVWVGPTAAAVAHLGSLGCAKGFGTFWGWGPWCPHPPAKASWCGRLARWGRVKKKQLLSSRGGGGVGATRLSSPSHPQSIRAQGDWVGQ